MNWPSHLAYPFIIAHVLAYVFDVALTPAHNVLIVVASMLPDFDYAFLIVKAKLTGRRFDAGVNHHLYASHWPISYSPLLVLLALFPSVEMVILVGGVFFHLIMDSFWCSFGIMWGYPFSKRPLNIDPLPAKDNLLWLKKWAKTRLATAEKVGVAAALLMAVFF